MLSILPWARTRCWLAAGRVRIMPTKCTCTRSHLCVNACSCEKLLGSSNSGGELNADPAVSQTLNDWRSSSRNASALSQAGDRADHDKQRIRRRMSSRFPLMPLSRRQVLAGCDGRFGNARRPLPATKLLVKENPSTQSWNLRCRSLSAPPLGSSGENGEDASQRTYAGGGAGKQF